MCELHETTSPAVGRRTLIRGAGGLLLGGGLLSATATAAQAATSQNGWSAGSSSVVPLSTLSVGAATFPAGVRRGDVHVVLGYVARRFEESRDYEEREVNELLRGFHDDTASLRRYLVDEGMLEREAGVYRRA